MEVSELRRWVKPEHPNTPSCKRAQVVFGFLQPTALLRRGAKQKLAGGFSHAQVLLAEDVTGQLGSKSKALSHHGLPVPLAVPSREQQPPQTAFSLQRSRLMSDSTIWSVCCFFGAQK